MAYIDAFQTLENKNNITQVEQEGPYLCNRKDAWLGIGYYLWDTNVQWAKDWGEKAYIKREKEYIIGKCTVDLSSCFDLFGNIKHQLEFKDVSEFVVTHKLFKGKQIIVPNLIEYMKKKGVFNYKSIRSSDEKQPQKKDIIYFTCNKKEYVSLNNRVQICILDKENVIKSKFKIVFP
jgi:hypothetical protein